MAKIVEFRTVNIAVRSWRESARSYEALGLVHAPAHAYPEPPASIVDVGFRLPGGGGFSLIEPTDASSPVARFLERRGPGLYSMTFRVDDLRNAMTEWSARGIEWVRPEPLVLRDAHVPPYRVERVLMNWIRPSSLGGVLVEISEFQGEVKQSGPAMKDWRPAP